MEENDKYAYFAIQEDDLYEISDEQPVYILFENKEGNETEVNPELESESNSLFYFFPFLRAKNII